jgi:ribosome-associated toxin RatA of RatAB toxin-antitoxin module
MGMSWAEHSVEVEAPIETCFDAIVDYESFPGWQDAVDSVEVLDRTKDGIGQTVKLFVDAKVRKIDYTLRYSYERPTEIHWEFVSGNGMRDVGGVYTFEELSPGTTLATYKLGADPEIPVPGPVARRVHRQLVKRSVEDLKGEAERRYAAGEGPAPVAAAAEKPKKRFGRSAPEPEPEAPPARAGGEEWVPKARRESVPPTPDMRAPRHAIPGYDVLSNLPVAGKAISAADGVVRTGREIAGGAVKTGLGIGKQVVRRVDEILSGSDRGPSDRR